MYTTVTTLFSEFLVSLSLPLSDDNGDDDADDDSDHDGNYDDDDEGNYDDNDVLEGKGGISR